MQCIDDGIVAEVDDRSKSARARRNTALGGVVPSEKRVQINT
jgi:hypothetical protein